MAIGASLRFVTTNIDDKKIVRAGWQLAQSSYNSLLPPYVHIGVGKSINYIESLNAATTIAGEVKNCIRTPIIPNSQIIVYGEE